MRKRDSLRQPPLIITPSPKKGNKQRHNKTTRSVITSLNGIDGNQVQELRNHKPIITPESEKIKKVIIATSSSTNFIFDFTSVFDLTPELNKLKEDEVLEYFCQRCTQCFYIINFEDEKMKQVIEDKTKSLNDILQVVSHKTKISRFGIQEYLAIFKLFLKNVVRSPISPPRLQYFISQIDYNDIIQEKSWEHLSIIYDIMINFISNRKFQAKLCPEIELNAFMGGIVQLFATSDLREREKLSKLFHEAYKAISYVRPTLRNHIASFFNSAISSGIPPFGVAELLSVFTSIIIGFKVPLLHENESFFHEVLLPLHINEQIKRFHQALANAVIAYCEKQPSLAIDTIQFILKHWPIQCTLKQRALLVEIEKLLAFIKTEACSPFIERFCSIYADAVSSENFTLVEESLVLFRGENIIRVMAYFGEITYKLLLPAITETATSHWCEDVKPIAIAALSLLKSKNEEDFNYVVSNIRKINHKQEKKEKNCMKYWKYIIDSSNPQNSESLMEQIADFYGAEFEDQ